MENIDWLLKESGTSCDLDIMLLTIHLREIRAYLCSKQHPRISSDFNDNSQLEHVVNTISQANSKTRWCLLSIIKRNKLYLQNWD